jgi:predicted AlkP superfamily pyrophosphatase or phosphodiesterase
VVGEVLKEHRLTENKDQYLVAINVFNIELFKSLLKIKYEDTLAKWKKYPSHCSFAFGEADKEEEEYEFGLLYFEDIDKVDHSIATRNDKVKKPKKTKTRKYSTKTKTKKNDKKNKRKSHK